jgi:hypothetical protein
MSGTTFGWVGAANTDWTNPTNWSGGPAGTFPSSGTVVAVVPTNLFPFPIISGGTTITLSSLNSTGTGHVIVGGGPLGGTGTGTLTAGSISVSSVDTGGGLVGQQGGTITTPSLTVGTGVIIGGGGTFNVTALANSGIIQADGGNFNLGALTVTGGTITGTGSIEVDGTSTFELGSATAEVIDVVVAPTETGTVIFDNSASFTGSLNLFNAGTHLDLTFKGQTPTAASFDPGTSTLIVMSGTTTIDTIPMTSNGIVGPVSVNAAGTVSIGLVCYARGTRIGTPAGSAPVEDLAAGDLVLTAQGEARPIV